MNGGLLVQDCTDHAIRSTHPITDGEVTYEITSTHHQMQYPYNLSRDSYTILFISNVPLSTYYYGDQIEFHKIQENGEPEIVLYHREGFPKCLAVQGHPEMIPDSPVAKMISKLIKDLVNENK